MFPELVNAASEYPIVNGDYEWYRNKKHSVEHEDDKPGKWSCYENPSTESLFKGVYKISPVWPIPPELCIV